MRQKVILDTGPLVALINRREHFHDWTKEQWSQIKPPLLTCEAVIVESCFLLKNASGARDAIFSLIKKEQLIIPFKIWEEITAIDMLINRYESVPMSLADACLVRMIEKKLGNVILTIDSDFLIYRQNKNEIIPIISPIINTL